MRTCSHLGSAPGRQTGVLLIDLMIASAVGALLVIGLATVTLGKARQSNLNRMVAQAVAIATVAEAMGRRVTGSAIDPGTGVYTYTFGGRSPDYRSVTFLNNQLGTSLPTLTDYGTGYQYVSNGGLASARFTVPAAEARRVAFDSTYQTETLGTGAVRVTVQANRSPAISRYARMTKVKREYYLENTR